MKKLLLIIVLLVTIANKTTAQSLGNITFSYCLPCGYVGLVDYIVVSPVPGATEYHFFSPQPFSPAILINGQLLPVVTPMNNPSIVFTATQASYTVCVYATNACCTTDTACCIIPGTAPQPLMSPSNSSTALPNSSGIYSVLPPPPNTCVAFCMWTLIPSSAGTITGNGNDTVTVNFSPTFTTCQLCANFQLTFNLNGPDTCMTINAPVGMDEFGVGSSEFTVYPNPAGDELIVSGLQFPVEVKIYDVMGKFVLSKQVTTLNSKLKTVNLSPGIYFIEINNVRKKFVKQ